MSSERIPLPAGACYTMECFDWGVMTWSDEHGTRYYPLAEGDLWPGDEHVTGGDFLWNGMLKGMAIWPRTLTPRERWQAEGWLAGTPRGGWWAWQWYRFKEWVKGIRW